MYQSQTRPRSGREFDAQQSQQLNSSSRICPRVKTSTISFLRLVHLSSDEIRIGGLALLVVCAVEFLSGCGGVIFASGKSQFGTSSTTTTTAVLSAVSCGTQSLTGPQSKACSVYLSAAAASRTTVSLTSSQAALQVPTSVVVAKGAKTAGFDVVSQSVTKSVSVTITAKEGTTAKTDVITLYPVPTTAAATLTKVSCGTQTLTGPTTKGCSVYLSSAAGSQVKVSLSSSSAVLQVPSYVTVAAGATTAGFGATASAVTNTQTVTLTASANGVSQNDVLQVEGSGTPTTQHKVELSWLAPSSTAVAIVGYRVYRAPSGGSYQLLNSTLDAVTSYADTAVQSGETYDYFVKSVDAAGTESAPSNATAVTVP